MTDEDNAFIEETAVKYARWLATRDGLYVAKDAETFCEWGNSERVFAVTFSTLLNSVTIKIPNWNWQPQKEAA